MNTHCACRSVRGTALFTFLGVLLVCAGAAFAAPRDEWAIGVTSRDGRSAVTALRGASEGSLAYTLDNGPGGALDSPAICLDGTGRAAAAWVRREAGVHRILLAIFDGTDWTAPAEVATSTAYLSTPSLSFAEGDSFWIAWAFQNGELDDIRVVHWRGGITGSWTFGHPDYPDIAPAVASEGPGRATLLWNGCDGSVYRWHRAAFSAGAWSSAVLVEDVSAAGGLLLGAGTVAGVSLRWADSAIGAAGDSPAAGRVRELAAGSSLRWDTRPGVAWREDGRFWSGPLPLEEAGEAAPVAAEPVGALSTSADRSFILGVGDSTTYGRGSTYNGPPTDYLNRLQGMLKGPWIHINRGVPGDISSGVLNRMDTELTNYPGGLVILIVGTNDAYNGYNPSGTVANLHLAADKVKARGGTVLLCTTPPVLTAMSTQFARLALLNPMIVSMASTNGFSLVDLWTLFRAQAGWEIKYIDPTYGIHPNDRGYDFMALKIRLAILRRGLLMGDLRWQAMEPLRAGQLTSADSAATAQYVLDPYSYLAQNDINAVAALDLDGDGVDSLGVIRSVRTNQTLTIYSAPPSGSFDKTDLLAAVQPVAEGDWISQSSGWITHLFGIDIDGDGNDEIGLMRYRSGTQVLEIWRAHQPGVTTPERLVYDEWHIPTKGRVNDIAAIQADGDAAEEIIILTEAYIGGAQGLVILDTPPLGADTAAANNEPVLYQNNTAVPPMILQITAQDISDPPDGLDELILLRARHAGRKDLLAAYALPALPAADNTPLTLLAKDRWVRIGGPDSFFLEFLRLSDGAGGVVPTLSFWLNP